MDSLASSSHVSAQSVIHQYSEANIGKESLRIYPMLFLLFNYRNVLVSVSRWCKRQGDE
jgi:hypothetical protein